MRAVVQRVSQARVISEGQESGAIGKGFCVLLGVEAGDTEKDAVYMADKIRKLRVFEDENDKMNLSLSQVNGAVLLVSQFTLLGEITSFVDDMKLPITAVAVKVNKNKTCSIIMTLKVRSRSQVDEAIKKLQNRSDVIEAYRSAK